MVKVLWNNQGTKVNKMEVEKPTTIIKKSKNNKIWNFLYWKNKFSKEKNVCCTYWNIENLLKTSLSKKKVAAKKSKKTLFSKYLQLLTTSL